jgi:hypothetical protein
MIASLAFGQDCGQAKGCMVGMEKEGGMPPMMGMMSMMGNLVATNDGGVVVLMGLKLYKYDKNLNLVKEAEIKVDMKNMQRMMECPKMSDEDKGKAKRPVTPEETSGHESYHPQ